jgi:hypothetical protein
MGYTCQQHMQNRIAAQFGYKISEGELISTFKVGEGIIVLNRKGEPMMSGTVEGIETSTQGNSVKVGDNWYDDATYLFRVM